MDNIHIIEVASWITVLKGPNGVAQKDVRVKYNDSPRLMTLEQHWADQKKRKAKVLAKSNG